MHTSDHIADLIFKYIRDELSTQEELQLTNWRQESQDNEDIFSRLTNPENIKELLQGFYSRDNTWRKLLEKAPELNPLPTAFIPRAKPFISAAAVVLLLGAITTIGFIANKIMSPNKQSVTIAVNKIDSLKDTYPAGTNKAMLILSNGNKIILDSTKTFKDVYQLGNNIKSLDSGKLKYETTSIKETDKETFNILKTPRGGQFQISLCDGSKVWLNAASSIKYPIAFKGSKRSVEISGEVYFEVTRNENSPFVVTTRGINIQVLGTHFNVNAYNDEAAIAVTLLEGRIKTTAGLNSIIQTPGDQALIEFGNAGPKISLLKNVNGNDIVSWKNGRTFFQRCKYPNDNAHDIQMVRC